MLVRTLKEGTGNRIAMGPRALTASSGLAPWSMAVDRTSAAYKKNPTAHGGQGGVPPHAAAPTGEERGLPSQFPHQLKKLEGSSTEPEKSYL